MAPSMRIPENKRKNSSIWTWQAEVALVNFVKKRRFMWYPRDRGFFNKAKKDAAFKELANQLGPLFSVGIVKDRWSNIRSTFMVNQKKISENPPKDGDEGYSPSWPLYEHLLFLKEARYVRTSNSCLYQLHRRRASSYVSGDITDSSSKDNGVVTGDEDQKDNAWESTETMPLELVKTSSGASSPQPIPALPRSATPHYSESSRSDFSWHSDKNKLPSEHRLLIRETVKEMSGTINSRNVCDSFGAVVAASLREMHTFHRSCAQLEIQQILMKYNPENPEVMSGIGMY